MGCESDEHLHAPSNSSRYVILKTEKDVIITTQFVCVCVRASQSVDSAGEVILKVSFTTFDKVKVQQKCP